jgi:hypothetical protein
MVQVPVVEKILHGDPFHVFHEEPGFLIVMEILE